MSGKKPCQHARPLRRGGRFGSRRLGGGGADGGLIYRGLSVASIVNIHTFRDTPRQAGVVKALSRRYCGLTAAWLPPTGAGRGWGRGVIKQIIRVLISIPDDKGNRAAEYLTALQTRLGCGSDAWETQTILSPSPAENEG